MTGIRDHFPHTHITGTLVCDLRAKLFLDRLRSTTSIEAEILVAAYYQKDSGQSSVWQTDQKRSSDFSSATYLAAERWFNDTILPVLVAADRESFHVRQSQLNNIAFRLIETDASIVTRWLMAEIAEELVKT